MGNAENQVSVFVGRIVNAQGLFVMHTVCLPSIPRGSVGIFRLKVKAGVWAVTVGGSGSSGFGFIRLTSLVIYYHVMQYTVSRTFSCRTYKRHFKRQMRVSMTVLQSRGRREGRIASGRGGVAMAKCVQ